MTWFKSNWRWAALNLIALSITLILLTQGSTDWSATATFDPTLAGGKWALRFLLICLSMTPFQKYFGWRSALKLRKPAGLWAFAFALLHVLGYLRESQFTWLQYPPPLFMLLGLLAFLILAALALTSNRRAMRLLKKDWKRLHRFVYLAANLVVFHALIATTMSKKIAVRDPDAAREMKVYLALLVVLLVVRVPLVRRALLQIPLLLRHRRTAAHPLVPPTKIRVPEPHYRPQVYMRSADIQWNHLPPDAFPHPTQPEHDPERERILA